MDMELLSRMVGELILDHDHVGLPGVGTFVAEIVPASFSDRGYTINPPYRRLSFSASVLEEDLLVDFYAAENSIGRPAAKAYLTAFLAEMKEVLKDRKAVTFPGLGRLRATRQNAFFFVPLEDLDIYPEGFALEPVSLKTHIETDEEVSIAVSDLASILEAARHEPEPVPAAPVPAPASEPLPVAPAPEPAISEPVAEKPSILEQASELSITATAPAVESSASDAPVTEISAAEAFAEAPRKKRRGWIWPVAVVGVAALLLIAFLVLARVAPDFIDSLLYTEEELRIINA